MEDQVAKLRELGLRAERIHSGRDRAASRQACVDYLAGRLDFLFIAPERLARARLPRDARQAQAGARSRSTRRTASRSGGTTSAPTTGCSASACRCSGRRRSSRSPPPPRPSVQDDIVDPARPRRRRGASSTASAATNLAIEVVELRPVGARATRCAQLLAEPGAPAGHRLRADAQGGRGARRASCGTRLRGRRLPRRHDRRRARPRPGRLPRRPARGDRRHHRLRHGRRQGRRAHRHPHRRCRAASRATTRRSAAPAATASRPARSSSTPSPTAAPTSSSTSATIPSRDVLRADLPGADRRAAARRRRSASKLGARRGGLREGAREALDPRRRAWSTPTATSPAASRGWQRPYLAQRDHKLAQLDQMVRFAEAHGCRMLHLVRHFGDQEDSGQAVRHLRRLRLRQPASSAASACRRRTRRGSCERILRALRQRDGQSTGPALPRDLRRRRRRPRPPPGRRPQGLRAPARRALPRRPGRRSARTPSRRRAKLIRFQRAAPDARGPAAPGRTRALLVQLARGARAGGEAEAEAAEESPRRAGSRAAERRAAQGPGRRSSGPSGDRTRRCPGLVEALKAWRRAEAQRRRVPAFRILTDRALDRPRRRPAPRRGGAPERPRHRPDDRAEVRPGDPAACRLPREIDPRRAPLTSKPFVLRGGEEI